MRQRLEVNGFDHRGCLEGRWIVGLVLVVRVRYWFQLRVHVLGMMVFGVWGDSTRGFLGSSLVWFHGELRCVRKRDSALSLRYFVTDQ